MMSSSQQVSTSWSPGNNVVVQALPGEGRDVLQTSHEIIALVSIVAMLALRALGSSANNALTNASNQLS